MLIIHIQKMVTKLQKLLNHKITHIQDLYIGHIFKILYIEQYHKESKNPYLFRLWYERRTRIYDNFQIYLTPAISIIFYQLWDLAPGFKMMTVLPWLLFYTRLRDKSLDPDFK
jgi:hypothetical protein